MTTRNAFLPLQSFLTSVEPNVNARAHKLYNQARSKTRPGSGNDLSPDLAANITAMASACLMLAQIEASGASEVDQAVYQRQASMKPAHFKLLLQTLRGVLTLQGDATTPSKAESSRKRKASAMLAASSEPDSPLAPTTTPTKSAAGSARRAAPPPSGSSKAIPTPLKAGSVANRHATATDSQQSTPTRSSARSSVRKSGLVRVDVSGEQKEKNEADMAEAYASTQNETSTTPTRRSARVAAASVAASSSAEKDEVTVTSISARKRTQARSSGASAASPSATTTPTKSSRIRGSATTSEAFEAAMKSAVSPTATTTPTKQQQTTRSKVNRPSSAKRAQLGPFADALRDETQQEEVEVPYEPYLDDMLGQWRDPAVFLRLQKEVGDWQTAMFRRLSDLVT